ncbi:PAQR family membrane homeostasis protein TrhA [Devosia naphthalenivorans]|uniref:PAQR family membrane homeostasis protein TrhA n=1 Tax=Devosia naphthalenivorans TaxID=2082392 RepID=UPI001FE38FEF|nr:hemolysin III family protein [Devosia naphthalenivorans]
MTDLQPNYSWWSREQRPYTRVEMIVDAVVHVLGLLVALIAGSILLIYAVLETAPEAVPALTLYLISFVTLFSISMAYNLWPVTPVKMHLARFDQAAIFLFIAGTYTPFLAIIGGTAMGMLMTSFVWGASLVGIALKLIVPERFGRLAIVLYLAIGWSGLLVFQSLAQTLPDTTLWLLLAGGVTYSLGIIFHLWERLRFQNALWHVFVVGGASFHLWAVIDCMVIHRL